MRTALLAILVALAGGAPVASGNAGAGLPTDAPAPSRAGSDAAATCRLEYLHVQAGEGMSSGGHAAICFETLCYHFVHADGGGLELRREPRGRLEFGYRVLGNRGMHALAPVVDEDACRRARQAFVEQWRIRQRQAAILAALDADVALASGRLDVRGAGYVEVGAALSPALEGLAARILDEHGAGALVRGRDRARAAMREALLGAEPEAPADPRPDRLDAPWHGRAAAWSEAASWQLAAEVLLRGGGLAPDALAPEREEVAPLAPAERDALVQARQMLQRRLVELFADGLDGPGADGHARAAGYQGYAMLVGMARLAAIEWSLASDRLRVLDVFPADAEVFDAAAVSADAGALAAVLAERRADAARERHEFFARAGWSELHFSRMETATALVADLGRALDGGAPLRVPVDALLPGRARELAVDVPTDVAQALSARARQRRDRYRQLLASGASYDLLRANCVTELWRVLAEAGAVDPLPAAAVSPALAAGALMLARPDTVVRDLPSYRMDRVARRARVEGAFVARLVESNVLSSSVYRPHAGDSPFLFFSEGAGPLRPVAGAVNLAVAMLEAVGGLGWWPVDGGQLLGRSLAGVLSSSAELGFVSIRKGTLVFAPMAWLPSQETAGGN